MKNNTRRTAALALCLATMIPCVALHAQVNGSWITNGNGAWSAPANWSSNPSIPGEAGSTVNFTNAIGGARTIDLGAASRTVGIMNVGTASGGGTFGFIGDVGTSLIFDNGVNPAQLNFTVTSRADSILGVNLRLDTSLNVSNAGATGLNKTLGSATRTISAGSGSQTLTNSGPGAGRVWLQNVVNGGGTLAVRQNSATSPLILGTVGTANTYSGGTTLDAGIIFLGSATADTPFGSGTVTLNAGTLNTSGSSTVSFSNATQINGNIAFLDSVSGNGGLTMGGAVTITNNVELDVGKSTLSLGATTLSDGGNGYSLTKTGAGTFALGSFSLTTHTGGTIIKAGILSVVGIGNHFDDISSVTVDGGAFNVSTDETIGVLTLTSGSVGGATGTFTASSYAVQSGTISREISGGSSALTKSTSGTVTLSAANNYGGSTTISAGALVLTGAGTLGTGSVSIANGATLDISGLAASSYTLSGSQTLSGSGIVDAAGKTLVVNGTLAPGTSPGLLTVDGAFTLGTGSSTQIELDGLARGISYDALNVTGLFTLDGTINVTGSHLFAASNSFDIFNWGSLNSSGFNVGTDLLLPTLSGGLSWDTSSFLTAGVISVVPEPSTYGLIAAGILGLIAGHRRIAGLRRRPTA